MKALVGFAGFGGVDIALKSFGFDVIGVEIDDAIAAVNRSNGGHCLTADLLDINPADYIGWLLFHFSPPCPNFSVAKVGGAETEADLTLARKICEFIRVGRPEYLTLENVWMYRKSLGWMLIWYTLLEEGYGVDAWNLNAADYGVPQSRRRMIVIARRDGRRPTKPFPTHSKKPDMFTRPWRNWHEAIEDLLPTLPETQFAAWQMDQMPDEQMTYLCTTGNTVCASPDGGIPKAFLLGQGSRSSIKNCSQPSDTITANNNQTGVKVFVMASANRRPIRVGYPGAKVVSMSTRCLARFQDFPDSFQLPSNRALACRGIGNALPPSLYRAVLKSLGFYQ